MAKDKEHHEREQSSPHASPATPAVPAAAHAAQQKGVQPAPKPVTMKIPRDAEGREAAEGAPVPPQAGEGSVPRAVHQNERAPEGLRRCKVRCVNYSEFPFRYILAHAEDEAKSYYLQSTGLLAMVALLPPDHEEPVLTVRTQPD